MIDNSQFKTIEFQETGKLAILKLNRPDKRNALNGQMIAELKIVFDYLKSNRSLVLLQFIGKGNVFCAGADISWLKDLHTAEQEKIKSSFSELNEMLKSFYEIPQISVIFVHGAAIGGGLGLISCADFVISAPETVFSFSEINLGIIPATISPFVIRKIGYQQAKKLFFLGSRFDENKALQIDLIDQIANSSPSDLNYITLIEELLSKSHEALLATKQLLKGVENGLIHESRVEVQTNLITELLKSETTKKLFEEFLAKK